MRISTIESYQGSLSTLQRMQSQLFESQQRLTTMMRVSKASDDPAAAAQAERARAQMMRNDASMRSVGASSNAMTLAESAMGDASELMQQARELVLQAGNASLTDSERRNIAQELSVIRLQLLGVANRTDGNNSYLFSGQGAGGAPFVDTSVGVRYTGVGGQVMIAGVEPLPLTVDGGNVWTQARTGNGVFETRNVDSDSAWIDSGRVLDPSNLNEPYTVEFGDVGGVMSYTITRGDGSVAVADAPFTDGQSIDVDGIAFTINGAPASGDTFEVVQSTSDQSIFNALDAVIEVLDSPLGVTPTDAQRTQAVQSGLRDIDASMLQMQGARSGVGETLNRLDGYQQRLEDSNLAAETRRSLAEDLDMTAGVTEFQTRQVTYSAALQSYSMVQQMSLFNYIKT